MKEQNKIFNGMPGLNDIPQRPLEFDEAVNVINASEKAVKAGNVKEEKSPINVTEPFTRARFLIDGLNMLPKTTKNWFVKRLILWQIGGDNMILERDHTIKVKPAFNGAGYTPRQIADLLKKFGYANMVDEFVYNKGVSYYRKVELLLEDCVNVVCDCLSKRNNDVIPIIGGN